MASRMSLTCIAIRLKARAISPISSAALSLWLSQIRPLSTALLKCSLRATMRETTTQRTNSHSTRITMLAAISINRTAELMAAAPALLRSRGV